MISELVSKLIGNRGVSELSPSEKLSNQQLGTGLTMDNAIKLHNRLFQLDKIDSLDLRLNAVFEPEETRLCSLLIKEGDVCLDIGANIGYYTTLFANIVGENGNVIAIEPDYENYKILEMNCASYIKDNYSLSLHQVALSHESGSALLFKSKDNHGMHRLYSSVCCSDESTEVRIVKGDSLVTTPVNFIKINIEGYELPALKGLSTIINASTNIKIITEFSPLSIGEAGFLSRDFIGMMLSYGLTPLENQDGEWRTVQTNELLAAAEIADKVDIPNLTKNMACQTNQEIAEAAAQALIDIGYSRPLLENLVWLRSYDVSDVLTKLSVK